MYLNIKQRFFKIKIKDSKKNQYKTQSRMRKNKKQQIILKKKTKSSQ